MPRFALDHVYDFLLLFLSFAFIVDRIDISNAKVIVHLRLSAAFFARFCQLELGFEVLDCLFVLYPL